jgi:outer membrane protein
MIAKKNLWLLILCPTLGLGGSVPDLLAVVQSSLNYDPTYLNTFETNNSTMASVGITRANLMPQLSGTVSKSWSWSKQTEAATFGGPGDVSTSSVQTRSVGLSLSQSIFNFSYFKQLAASKVSAIAATLSTQAAYQTLLETVASSYFNVASAQAVLTINEQQVAINKKLVWYTEQQFKAGAVLYSDVLTAKASLLSAEQTVLSQKQTLIGYQNTLSEHTPKKVGSVKEIEGLLIVKQPKKARLHHWIEKGLMLNPTVLEQKLNVLSAKKTVQADKAALLPNLSATYSYSGSNSEYGGTATTEALPTSQATYNSFGVTLNIPLYQGGSEYATIKKDTYSFMAAQDSLNEQKKTTASQISTYYKSLVLQAETINNLKESVLAYKNNYLAILKAYELGKETMSDVQNALSSWYSQQSSLVQAEYTYLSDYISLKQNIGNLSMDDIQIINNWMHKHVQS